MRRDAIPADLAAGHDARAEFPTLYQLTTAQPLSAERRAQTVGVEIKPAP